MSFVEKLLAITFHAAADYPCNPQGSSHWGLMAPTGSILDNDTTLYFHMEKLSADYKICGGYIP